MKKLITLIPVLVSAMMLINNPGIAQTNVFIPDTNFRSFLNTNHPTFMDISGDSLITDSAAIFTGILSCSSQNIADLTGVEYFVNITQLWCDNNQLTALPDLTNNTALKELYCYYNQLTALPDLTNNTALQQLYCYTNQLTALPDLTNNTALKNLFCYNNKLDFSDARELRIADTISTLSFYDYSPQNPFGIPATVNMYVGDTLILSIANQDSALSYQWFRGTDTLAGATDTLLIIPDITFAGSGAYTCESYGTALLSPSPMSFPPGFSSFVSETFTVNIKDTLPSIKVFIPGTNFRNFLNTNYPTFMDISGDSLIIDSAATLTGTLDCSGLNIVDLTGIEYFVNITRLYCITNQLTALPALTNNTALLVLWCSNNQLTSLPTLTNNTALQELYCSGNQLTVLPDLSNNTALWWLDCYNNQLTALPALSANTALWWLDCSSNQLTTLPDLTNNTALEYLYCNSNQLTALPSLMNNTALQRLYCYGNQLTALPALTNNTALLRLYCYGNQLTALPDLTNNTVLQEFDCSFNQLTTLPALTNNTALQWLRCQNNQLTSLPALTNNTALQVLLCDNNKLDFSDARELRIADTISTLLFYTYSPQNPFGIPDTFNLNAGDTLILSIASQDSALSYQWFRGTDTIAGATDTLLIILNVTLADSGIYTCRSFGTALQSPPMSFGPGISSFISEPLTVNILSASLSASISYQKNVSCNGGMDGEAAVTVTGGSPPYTLQWSDSSAQITDTAYSLFADIYYVVVTDSLGAVDTAYVTITEPPAITGSQTLTICAEDSVVVGTSVYDSTGVYTDVFTASNGCDSIFTTNLLVNSLPAVSFSGLDTGYCTTDPPVTLTGTPSGGTFSGTGISGDQFDPDNAGTGTHIIVYSYTDGNGCTDTVSKNVTITICTGIDGLISEKTIKLFPNPNTGEFIIEMFFLKEVKELEIKITNILGQDLYYEQLKQFTGKYHREINFSDYAKGVYRLQIKTNNTTVNKKIILE